MQFYSSLKHHVLLNLSYALLPVALIISLNIWYEFRVESKLVGEEADNVVRALANEQLRRINTVEHFLSKFSQLAEIKQPSTSACNTLLKKTLTMTPQYQNLGVPLANGDLLCNAKPLSYKVNVSDREYFQKAINEEVFSIGNFQVDRATQSMSLNFAYPVYNAEREVIAAVVAVADLNWLSDKLAKMNLPENSIVLLADSTGKVITSKHKSNQESVFKTLNQLFKNNDIVNGKAIQVKGSDNISRLVLSVDLFPSSLNHGTTLVVALPIEHIYKGMFHTFLRNIILFFIGGLCFLFILFLGLNKSVLRPVQQLLASTQKYVATKWGGSSKNTNELAQLSQHFELVLKEQTMIEQALINKEQSLNRAYTRINNLLDNSTYGVVEWDPNLVIRRWSKVCSAWFHLQAEQLLGQDILNREDNIGLYFSQMRNELQKMSEGQTEHAECELPFISSEGKSIILIWKFSAIYDGEDLIGILGLVDDITKQVAYQQEIEHQARFDGLTGLPNRYAFIKNVNEHFQASNPLSVLHIDIKGFKFINDHYGHAYGDNLLVELSHRITNQLRQGEFFARLGGNEFVYLIPSHDKALVSGRIEVLHAAFGEPIKIEEANHITHINCGVVTCDSCDQSADELLRQAGVALHYAKRHSLQDVYHYSADMEQNERIRFNLESELRDALDNDEFELYYQPIINHKINRFDSAEALIRWNSPTRGLVFPDQFIPLTEETGLIHQLGHWVLVESVKQLKQWQSNDIGIEKISVNMSAIQLNDADIVDKVRDVIRFYDINPDSLVIEVTESALLDSAHDVLERIKNIQDLGVLIALDDFGTGYSSLSYLSNLPLNRLKIDRSFVDRIGQQKDEILINAIITIAHGMDLVVIAEGIENTEHLSFLMEKGCEYGQGYLFSKPIPVREFEAFIQSAHRIVITEPKFM